MFKLRSNKRHLVAKSIHAIFISDDLRHGLYNLLIGLYSIRLDGVFFSELDNV